MTDAVSLTVSHAFAVAPSCVYAAWVERAWVEQWLFASESGRIISCELDVSVGGQFSIVDARDTVEVEHTGVYLEVEPEKKLVFTLSVPKYGQETDRVTVEFLPTFTGTRVKLTHQMAPSLAAMVPNVTAGWKRLLARLDALLDPPSCGQGLAKHASVPASLGKLLSAMAKTLEVHMTTLPESDVVALAEHDVYRELATEQKALAKNLLALSEKMQAYRGLAASPHDDSSAAKARLKRAFTHFVEAQEEVVASLKESTLR